MTVPGFSSRSRVSIRCSFGCLGNRDSSIFHRCQPAMECVRTALVIVPPPRFDIRPRVFQRQEPVGVQAFMPQAAERFHERIVRRLARTAEVQRDAILVGPAVERLRDELRPIVDPNSPGRAARQRLILSV